MVVYFQHAEPNFALDISLKTLLKLDVTLSGPDTELAVMENWGRSFVKSWVSCSSD